MRICVIGAGLAGLAAADAVARAGVEVIVLEARDRVGGRVWSDRLSNGALIERGGEFITGGYTQTERLCQELGLPLDGMGIRYPDRRLHPDPGLRREDVVAASQAVELAAHDAPTTPALVLLEQTVVDPAIRELLASRVQSAKAHSIADLDGRYLTAVTKLVEDDETRRIRGGNQLLAERLATRSGATVHLGTPVRAIAHDTAGVRVTTDQGSIDADAAIVAIPLTLFGDLAFSPPLPAVLTAALGAIRTSVAAKLAVPLAATTPPDAVMSVPRRFWAYTTPCDEVGCTTLGSWAGAAPVVDDLKADTDPEAWLDAIRELWPALPGTTAPATITSWQSDPWARGAYSVRPPIPDPEEQRLLTTPVGRLILAGEATAADGWAGTIEGALRSGLRAAELQAQSQP